MSVSCQASIILFQTETAHHVLIGCCDVCYRYKNDPQRVNPTLVCVSLVRLSISFELVQSWLHVVFGADHPVMMCLKLSCVILICVPHTVRMFACILGLRRLSALLEQWLHICQSTGYSTFRYCLFPLYLPSKGKGSILLHLHFSQQILRSRLLNSLSFITEICLLWAQETQETTLKLLCSSWQKADFAGGWNDQELYQKISHKCVSLAYHCVHLWLLADQTVSYICTVI